MEDRSTVPYYPSPKRGADGPTPGYWALKAKQTHFWPRGHRLRLTAGKLLHELGKLRLVREPGIRIWKETLTGDDFYYTVSSRISNITALLAQCVGVVVEPCHSCKHNLGMFSSCVIIPGLRHLIPCCANCYFNGLGDRCSFHQHGFPEITHPENQNGQGEASQTQDSSVKSTHEQIEERREMLLQLNEQLELAVEERDKSEIAVKDAEVGLLTARVALQENNAKIDKVLISKETLLSDWEQEMA
ncbi:uncharacterized protein N7483_006732 [Penicillium malachiteum]|uniref:uncharacterized protein n=1 Tax=Penicillium malachiteum TaxID=1324776 RepID=UPI0025470515|nr:uncharacterized protein N7483_006732 [Penicillium malachiteum]KAJ5725375.1 hypothetical protein N7483_006732 [Penicillium malachiteum]